MSLVAQTASGREEPSDCESGASARDEADLVGRQIGRVPRDPWRVVVRCQWERPSVIASPSQLADGTPFPTLYWLTCPFLIRAVGALESEGTLAEWNSRLEGDAALRDSLAEAHAALQTHRVEESGGRDLCAGVGVAGQRDASRIKCLHAHVALVLAGVEDPVGAETLALVGIACEDDQCATLADAQVEPATLRTVSQAGNR